MAKVKERPQKLIKKISEISKKNIGKGKKKKLPPMGKLMQSVGYSESYSENPKLLKGTETWQELLGIFIPRSKLAMRHGELIDFASIEHYVFPSVGRGKKKKELSDKEIKDIVESVPGCRLIYIKPDFYTGKVAFFQAPDGKVRKDALDMAFKLYGAYAPEQINLTKRKYGDLSDAELAARKKILKDFLLKRK